VRSQIHGNVCMAAVVVTEQLDWRLHGFDLLSEHAGGGFDWPLMASSWMVRLHKSLSLMQYVNPAHLPLPHQIIAKS